MVSKYHIGFQKSADDSVPKKVGSDAVDLETYIAKTISNWIKLAGGNHVTIFYCKFVIQMRIK
jgi:hypothetical protein